MYSFNWGCTSAAKSMICSTEWLCLVPRLTWFLLSAYLITCCQHCSDAAICWNYCVTLHSTKSIVTILTGCSRTLIWFVNVSISAPVRLQCPRVKHWMLWMQLVKLLKPSSPISFLPRDSFFICIDTMELIQTIKRASVNHWGTNSKPITYTLYTSNCVHWAQSIGNCSGWA